MYDGCVPLSLSLCVCASDGRATTVADDGVLRDVNERCKVRLGNVRAHQFKLKRAQEFSPHSLNLFLSIISVRDAQFFLSF